MTSLLNMQHIICLHKLLPLNAQRNIVFFSKRCIALKNIHNGEIVAEMNGFWVFWQPVWFLDINISDVLLLCPLGVTDVLVFLRCALNHYNELRNSFADLVQCDV